MCGLFGHTTCRRRPDLEASRRALHTLEHRGPDQWGEWHDAALYVGHRRLSILDLTETGRQPMIATETDGSHTVITVNGEIWNFARLREELSDRYEFHSRSDSEVILHGYREWGIEGLLRRIDGMYAIVVYDQARGRLHLARDRFGIKPLFFAPSGAATGEEFLYASEIKALFDFAPELRAFSAAGVREWIAYRHGRSPRTLYAGVQNLPPGHRIEVDVRSGRHEVHEYYNVVDHALTGTPSDPARLEELLERAVAKRLMSDVPLGLQLSGGVDSSLVAHELAVATEGRGCNSFSIGFAGEEAARYSEERYARHVADLEGFTHHQLNIGMHDVLDAYVDVVRYTDGMLAHPNTIPIFLLSRFAKELVTVQLTGEGADELFGGYIKFTTAMQLATARRSLPGGLDPVQHLRALLSRSRGARRLLHLHRRYAGDGPAILDQLNCYVDLRSMDRIFRPSTAAALSTFDTMFPGGARLDAYRSLSFAKQLVLADHQTYLVTLLDRQDRASMGASIESRVPFLDKDLIEWAVRLPDDQLLDHERNKIVLKNLCASHYGDEFTYRRKMGFPLPIEDWLRTPEFGEHVARVTASDSVLSEVIDVSYLRERLETDTFDNVLLGYSDSERIWLTWFFTVVRTAQDVFGITQVKD